MTKRMLIDSTHAEETRVVVLDGNRLEDFDVETETKKQLKGNIYLAKVVRVEPSLQAAFVEYGGGRHGFLAFGEIHPDYYQIPVADRQRLLAMQAEEARAEEDEDEPEQARPEQARPEQARSEQARAPRPARGERRPRRAHTASADAELPPEIAEQPDILHPGLDAPAAQAHDTPTQDAAPEAEPEADSHDDRPAQPALIPQDVKYGEVTFGEFAPGETVAEAPEDGFPAPAETAPEGEANGDAESYADSESAPEEPPPETIGGESDVFEGNGAEEARARRSSRFLRNYRIQEVIHRRQIMLVQVVKEERGTKGAALTTYISLAGRFCVLMPNSPRGGGVSRKITSAADRRRLKDIIAELDVPDGMGMIVRTAGANRPKPEIKRDCEYLMRLWDDIREHTLRSVAPALIYEEASLIKRAIRDVYSRDVDEVLVDGEAGWKAAHEFMRMLMPSHAKKVQLWKDGGNPLFSKYNVEAQLDAMLAPNVQLRSGGYLVINQAEALVAIDVNSGRSTRERGIEETALRTNLEAADEVARQLRLRDLAGLIVIDFIDMESRKHNTMVERRMKEALKDDRARIQLGHISHFGLMEMSRQRLRPSLAETTFVACPHCGGLGHVRGIESSAIHVLRAIEEEGGKARAALIMVHVANVVVMYILNHKRERLAEIEARTGMRVHFTADESLVPPSLRIERVRAALPPSERPVAAPVLPVAPPRSAIEDDEEEPDVTAEEDDDLPVRETEAAPSGEPGAAEDSDRPRRRRRRRRGGRRDGTETGPGNEAASEQEAGAAPDDEGEEEGEPGGSEAEAGEETTADAAERPRSAEAPELDENGQPRARRRGRRGGRRRRRDGSPGAPWADEPRGDSAEASEAPREPAPAPIAPPPPPPAPAFTNVYTGPTPADPFGGQQAFDIFDLMEQTEAAAAARPAVPEKPAPEPVVPVPVAAPQEAPEPIGAAEPEPPPAPLVKPIVLGQDPVPAAEPKRGWWRR